MTCGFQRQDVLFHVLYGGNGEYISGLIRESLGNIGTEHVHEGVRQALEMYEPLESDPLNKLRVKFFVLLNEDEKMRRQVCNVTSSVYQSMCVHKAERFYDELNDAVLPSWVTDGKPDLGSMVDTLREAYLCS
jgi:hypothetical protein